VELDALQNLFYADRRFKLLVVLQGLDTSGKDGTLRGVFGRMSPLGVHTVSWKAPSSAEREHDYLWRIHQQVPAAGEITVFNRSHYEDVLVPLVNGAIDAKQARQRYAQIRDFERLLSETGTVILKFMLHISKDEQRERAMQLLLASSLPIAFLAGFSWPREALPAPLWWLGELFIPAVPGIQAFLRLNQMGAPLQAVQAEALALTLQALAYSALAAWALRRRR
jgi:hypothetical protein